MTAQMLCAERDWCDFVMFDDRLPEKLSFRCVRYNLDKKAAQEMEQEVIEFLAELESEIDILESMNED